VLEAIRAEFGRLSLRGAALAAVSVVPFVAGWVAGFVVSAALWLAAAVVAGYKAGRGGE